MEGQSFEKQYEIPKSETGPKFDIESVLERGEIETVERLKGHSFIKVVRIKDDGEGLFKPGERIETTMHGEIDENRAALEFLAYTVDKILEFGLVPTTVQREIQAQKGALQTFVSTAVPATKLKNWSERVDLANLKQAAVFDYLINAQDRTTNNFLIDDVTGKIWLIDHDYYMFFEDYKFSSRIVNEARRKKLAALSSEILTAVTRLTESVDALIVEADEGYLKQILEGIKKRAKILLKTEEIPMA